MKKIFLFMLCMFALAYAAVTQTPDAQTQTYEVDALNAKFLTPGDRVDVFQIIKIKDITYAHAAAQNALVRQISGGRVQVWLDGKSKYSPAEAEVLKNKIVLRNAGDFNRNDFQDVDLSGLFR